MCSLGGRCFRLSLWLGEVREGRVMGGCVGGWVDGCVCPPTPAVGSNKSCGATVWLPAPLEGHAGPTEMADCRILSVGGGSHLLLLAFFWNGNLEFHFDLS